MVSPKFPDNEIQRLKAVKSYNILDSLPEEDYDNITELIATICDVPIALIAILDTERNYFKSHYGIPFNESPRNISFCGHTILEEEILIINDARKDNRFTGNPLLTEQNAVFYAGVPLKNSNGFALGTICVFDHKPRELNESQIRALKSLGKQVINLLELRRKNEKLKKTKAELQERNKRLGAFASHVSHDLKSPLANITSLTNLLKDDKDSNLSEESITYLEYIEESTNVLKNYIDGILIYYKSDRLVKSKKEDFNLDNIYEDIEHILISKNDKLIYSNVLIKNVNRAALTQILLNLVDNALKYNDKDERIVTISYQLLEDYHKFSVKDNGIGIPEAEQDKIFEIFKTVKNDYGKSSTGIGLSTVKNLVDKLNGEISVTSEIGKGSTFCFTVAK
ncbi:GAF domain-containing sensor histidine kinase [Winogradskyella endarachnes]|uniref:histidine kinase n=1 Tax=Winogradskyella endarachnes TaxID=2681965 RepID=A0A6L6U5X7_9FLAO|nr:GAF domain-containing sensor histidine kinase [Winogradskyella endarachnes]MUU77299.1 GAF domain-containing protein [Winogradskyella endarachnes]